MVEGVEHQHQVALRRLGDGDDAGFRPLLRRLAQQGFDAHRLVEEIGPGLALERGKPVEIEDVGGAAEVLQVGELQRRHGHLHGGVLERFRGKLGAQPRLAQPLSRLAADHLDQVAQFEHPASAGLERLAVRPVHGAEADVLQLALGGVAGQDGGAENHLEMVGLALVDRVDHQLRVEIAPPIEHGGQVGGAVHGRAFRRDHQERRQVALVVIARHPHDLGALVGEEQAFFTQLGDHRLDQVVDVALALPEVEIDAEGVEVALQRRPRHLVEMSPQQPVAEPALLQFGRGPPRAVAEGLVGLGPRRGLWIDPVEIVERHMGGQQVVDRLAIGLGEARRQDGQRRDQRSDGRMLVEDGDDEQPHLETPVAEMGVANHLVAAKAIEALQRLADDRRAQVADMHLLGDVRAAVIDQHPARRIDQAPPSARIRGDGLRPLGQGRVGQAQIDEAGPRHLDAGQPGIAAQALSCLGGDLARVAPGDLGRGQRAIDLKVGQLRPVGRRHAPEARLQSGLGEGPRRGLAERRREILH